MNILMYICLHLKQWLKWPSCLKYTTVNLLLFSLIRNVIDRLCRIMKKQCICVTLSLLGVQAKQEQLDELNKELRQCNLQQFIQQTGVLPAYNSSRTDLHQQLNQQELAQLLQDTSIDSGTANTVTNTASVSVSYRVVVDETSFTYSLQSRHSGA